MSDMEEVKTNAADFGGIQSRVLTRKEIAWHMCCAKGCAFTGAVQVPLPRLSNEETPLWRILCQQHFIQIIFVMDAFLGDPSPASEASRMADALGYGGDPLRHWKDSVALIFNPEFARCARCGGSFVAETIGMFSGKRYVHTCGITAAERRDQS